MSKFVSRVPSCVCRIASSHFLVLFPSGSMLWLIFLAVGPLYLEALPQCSSYFVRWPRVKLNFQAVASSRISIRACQSACSLGEDPQVPGRVVLSKSKRQCPGRGLECAALNHHPSPDGFSHHCDVFQPHQLQNVDGYVEADDRYSFYWKYCLNCSFLLSICLYLPLQPLENATATMPSPTSPIGLWMRQRCCGCRRRPPWRSVCRSVSRRAPSPAEASPSTGRTADVTCLPILSWPNRHPSASTTTRTSGSTTTRTTATIVSWATGRSQSAGK